MQTPSYNQSIAGGRGCASTDFSISSTPQMSRKCSFLLLPIDSHSKSDDTSLISSLDSLIISSTEVDDKNKSLINKNLEGCIPEVAQITAGVKVKKIFDGSKLFFKEKMKAQVIMFEHKNKFSPGLTSSSIEIVSFFYEFETVGIPRIYVSSSKVCSRLRNKLLVKGSQHEKQSIADYM
jgi:hypothetical protein